MRILLYAFSFICLFVAGCAAPPPPTPPAYYFEPPTRQISYLDDVEPVLVKRCVVCHSCYNSPCQLKLNSWDGLERGASKEKIYNASRLKTMDPSRLLVDAHSQAEWRQKGFFGVTQNEGIKSYDQSLLQGFLSFDMSAITMPTLPGCE